MKTKRSEEAYVLIDHRNSPGISAEFMHANNLPGPAVGAGQMYESAINVCHHCGADVILNPKRTRAREWCWNCDHYICDGCAALKQMGLQCIPLRKKLDEIFTALQANKLIF